MTLATVCLSSGYVTIVIFEQPTLASLRFGVWWNRYFRFSLLISSPPRRGLHIYYEDGRWIRVNHLLDSECIVLKYMNLY